MKKEYKDQLHIREPEMFMLFNQIFLWLPLVVIIFRITQQAIITIVLYIVWTLSNLREYHKNKKEQIFYEEQEEKMK